MANLIPQKSFNRLFDLLGEGRCQRLHGNIDRAKLLEDRAYFQLCDMLNDIQAKAGAFQTHAKLCWLWVELLDLAHEHGFEVDLTYSGMPQISTIVDFLFTEWESIPTATDPAEVLAFQILLKV